jgi:hypothetical protein
MVEQMQVIQIKHLAIAYENAFQVYTCHHDRIVFHSMQKRQQWRNG